MKLLILGDVMGLSGRKALKKHLKKILDENKIDFSVINGENAAEDGKGITKVIAEEIFAQGVDVITSETIFGIKMKQLVISRRKIDY